MAEEVRPWPAWVRYPLIAVFAVVVLFGLVLAVTNGVDSAVWRIVVAAVLIPALLVPLRVRGLRRRSQRGAPRLGEELTRSYAPADSSDRRDDARVPDPTAARLASLAHVRVRRLRNRGPLGLRRVFEVEYSESPDGLPTTTTTSRPTAVIKPLLGWDEAALVVRGASVAWHGDTGPWCAGLTGELEGS